MRRAMCLLVHWSSPGSAAQVKGGGMNTREPIPHTRRRTRGRGWSPRRRLVRTHKAERAPWGRTSRPGNHSGRTRSCTTLVFWSPLCCIWPGCRSGERTASRCGESPGGLQPLPPSEFVRAFQWKRGSGGLQAHQRGRLPLLRLHEKPWGLCSQVSLFANVLAAMNYFVCRLAWTMRSAAATPPSASLSMVVRSTRPISLSAVAISPGSPVRCATR